MPRSFNAAVAELLQSAEQLDAIRVVRRRLSGQGDGECADFDQIEARLARRVSDMAGKIAAMPREVTEEDLRKYINA